ncbi:hypothetical protein DN748_01960 [Sinomicrobium soli]|nr:hypothetical protein DN748_01960 [Sinomicrobium sp. N-1-3-6]
MKVKVSQKDQYFVFDTGATFSIFNTLMNGQQTGNKILFNDISGKNQYVNEILIRDTISIGDVKILNGVFGEYDFSNTDGLIGGDILKNLVLELDFINRKMIIHGKSSDISTLNMSVTEFKLKGSVPFVNILINNTPVEFMLDTGFNGFADINMRHISSIPFGENTVKENWQETSRLVSPFDAGNSSVKNLSKVITDIQIADRVLKNEVIIFEENLGTDKLGLDFLKRFDRVIIDYLEKRIYFGKTVYKSRYYHSEIRSGINSNGIKLSNRAQTTVVSAVSEKFNNKISIGDTVVQINGNETVNRNNSFYEDHVKKDSIVIYRHGLAKDTIVKYKKSAGLKCLLADFHYMRDSSEIVILRNGEKHRHNMIRSDYLFNLPDTIQDYYFEGLMDQCILKTLYKSWTPVVISSKKSTPGYFLYTISESK